MYYILVGLLFCSYIYMASWWFGPEMRGSGLDLWARVLFWLVSPLFVLIDWSIRIYNRLRGK
jgi:hypothetical protein